MLAKQLISLCLVGCLGSALPVAAQTGRVAHFSHSGSAVTLAAEGAAVDNFGEPPPYFVADSVRYLSDSKVVQYGKWHWTDRKETTDTLRLPQKMSAAEAARYVQHSYQVRWIYGKKKQLVGFDSTTMAPTEQPGKAKRKRKAAATNWYLPPPPTGLGLALLLLAGLAGAGGLLAGKPRSTASA